MVQYKKYTDDQNNTLYHAKGYLGVDVYGKQKNINKKGFRSKKEAQQYVHKAKDKVENGNYIKSVHALTFEDVYQEWLTIYQKDVKPSTFEHTKGQFRNHILPIFGKLTLKKITHRLVQKQVNIWHEEMAHYKQIFNRFKTIIIYAYKKSYMDTNPCNRVIIPKKRMVEPHTVTDKEFYTKEELKEFLEALKKEHLPQWHMFFRLLGFTGLRKGEALGLQWSDIDFKHNTLTVERTLTYANGELFCQSPKTENSNRTIALDQQTIHALKVWKKEQAQWLLGFGYNAMSPEQLLFSHPETNTFWHSSKPSRQLEKICNKYDLEPITIHGFRHTHCSLLFDAGIPMKDVKERLGHSDIKTTMDIYTHVTQSSRDKSAQQFAKYMDF